MQTKRRITGDNGEELAVHFLIQKGYQILRRNFIAREGEIDIIAQDTQEFVFVEVKTRKNQKYGTPLEGFSEAKAEKMIRTAYKFFLSQKIDFEVPWRIDLITVDMSQKPPKIEHFENILG